MWPSYGRRRREVAALPPHYGVIVTYRERLTVPVVWWILGDLFAFSLFVAVAWYLGLGWGIAVGAVCLAVLAVIFIAPAIEVTVDPSWLRVGRAQIELSYLTSAVPLDAAAAARRAGPDADARAYLALRPYVRTAVEITLGDSDDPTPYWLVSSRRPHELASALTAAISTRLAG
jgi:hypothetical protein